MGRFQRIENAHNDPEAQARDYKAPLSTAVGDQAEEEDEVVPNYYKIMDSVPEVPWHLSWLGDDVSDIDRYNDYL